MSHCHDVEDNSHLMENKNHVIQQQEVLLEKLVDDFAKRMKAKLLAKSKQGWNGWEKCPIENLENGLKAHIEKGYMVDVANYALMIDARNITTHTKHSIE